MFDVIKDALVWFINYLGEMAFFKWLIAHFIDMLLLIFNPIIEALLPDWLNPQSLLDSIPSEVYWFMWLIGSDIGIPLILTAMVIKFTIRRLPVVG